MYFLERYHSSTSWERRAKEEGIVLGMEKEKTEIARRLVAVRFLV
jgi:hypothetical protein